MIRLQSVNVVWENEDGGLQPENYAVGDRRDEVYFHGREDWNIKTIDTSDLSLERIAELAGKIRDGHAEEKDVKALADAILKLHEGE